MKTCTCGKNIEETEEKQYVSYDLQKGYEQIYFCSSECQTTWIRKKQFGMWTALIIGVIIAILLISEGQYQLALSLLFLPYMIRQVFHRIKGLFSSGTAGEIISFALVLLGSITIVYPAYKFVREFLEYRKYNSGK